MKRYIIIIAVISMSFTLCHGQQSDSLYFKGVILESDSLYALPYAKYEVNESEKFVADENGQFYFWAKKGDIVSFSYVGYKTVVLQIQDTLVQDNFLMGVFLSKDTIQLSEVVILPQVPNVSERLKHLPVTQDNNTVVAKQNISNVQELATSGVDAEMEYDADLNQRQSLNAKSDAVKYRTQLGPDQTIEISNLKIKELIDKRRKK